MNNREILRMERISMWLEGRPLLRCARLNLIEGEIIGVVGMNYSGKTALLGVAGGFCPGYEGDFFLDGKQMTITSPQQAKRLGIYYIQQKAALIDRLTIEENMLIAPGEGGTIIHRARSLRRIAALFRDLGLSFDCEETVGGLAFYQKFQLEVARAVLGNARVIILDGVLNDFSAQMLDSLQDLLNRLRRRRISLILADNGIRYLKPFCDRIFVMRKGMTAGILGGNDLNEDAVVSMMLGYEVRANRPTERREPPGPGNSPVLMEWRSVSYKNVLHNLSFSMREGEIVGLLNVNKNSGSAICEILTDADQPASGTILFDGKALDYLTTERTIRRGLAVLQDDSEIFENLSLAENISIASIHNYGPPSPFVNQRKLRYEVGELIDEFIRGKETMYASRSVMPDDRLLRRKILLCRMLISRPKLVVMVHPTLNMDELMAAEITDDIKKICARGIALMIVSTDMEFLLSICSRILIINFGSVEGDFPVTDATRADLLVQYSRYIKNL